MKPTSTSLKGMAKNYGPQDLSIMGIDNVDYPELRHRFYKSMQKTGETQSYQVEQIDSWWNGIKILLFVMCQRNHKKLSLLTEEHRRGQLIVWYARAMLEIVDYNENLPKRKI